MSAFKEICTTLERHRDNPALFESAVSEASRAIADGHVPSREFSIRRLFESTVDGGGGLLREWDDHARAGGGFRETTLLSEAGVNTTAFSNITGQVVFAAVKEGYESPAFFASELVNTMPTRQQYGDKIIGLGNVDSAFDTVGEAQPYPYAGLSEEWVETPAPAKRGKILPITKEAITFDLTGQLLQRAQSLGERYGYAKEKRILETMLGITSSYKRNKKSIVATYGDSSGDHDWDNLSASTPFVDYESLNTVEQLMNKMVDPSTGDYIAISADTIIAPKALAHKVLRALSATEVRAGDITTGTGMQTIFANPVANKYAFKTSPLVYGVTSSDTTWFVGNFRKAFAYMEVWPITVDSAPVGSQEEFTRDIAVQFKVSEYGVAAVIDPRFAFKCTA